MSAFPEITILALLVAGERGFNIGGAIKSILFGMILEELFWPEIKRLKFTRISKPYLNSKKRTITIPIMLKTNVFLVFFSKVLLSLDLLIPEPKVGFGPTTCSLRKSYSTTELLRRSTLFYEIGQERARF